MSRPRRQARPPAIAAPTPVVGVATPANVLVSAPLHTPAYGGRTPADGTHLALPAAMLMPPPPGRSPFGADRLPGPLAPAAPRRHPSVPAARVARFDLARRLVQLEAANRELETFSDAVAQDLQAPLREICGSAELLACEAGSTLGETARQHLDDITGAAARMSRLVGALLDLSRAGRARLRASIVDLDFVVHEIVSDQARQSPERAIDWVIGTLPAVRGDATLLGQVFTSLVANAVKFTQPRARACIEIGTAATADAAEVVVFVKDNGVGFDMRHAGRLFGAFERLHAPGEFDGAGVGLAGVQRIVDRHGGRVWATAAVGEGATFFVALPCGQPRPASQAAFLPRTGVPA
ncbi:MAG: hypothetical protein IT177_17690 [Acidobacteria bacterium]|nr:hypothetical protein [Acidobacteriota bacterium]